MDEAKNNQSNYDIPLWKRNLAEEKQHSEKTKIFLENIEKYREKVSQLTAQVKLLDELSNIPSIANIQIQVKTDCKECLEKERKILQLKIEKEKEKIAYEQLLITREKDLKKLEIEGRTDSLTKLNNRKKFEQDLHNLVQSGREFSVAVIDIDYFKKINDTYGHFIGDQVLKFVSSKLRFHLNAYRWGGEEFILIHEGSEQDLFDKVKILKNTISSHRMQLRNSKNSKTIKNKFFYVTFSAGVMAYDETMSETHFMDTVDSVMYYAKQQGGRDIVLGYQQVKNSLPKLNKAQKQANIPLELLHQTDNEEIASNS